jgi:hypothetical protein
MFEQLSVIVGNIRWSMEREVLNFHFYLQKGGPATLGFVTDSVHQLCLPPTVLLTGVP